jgi:hypothetical protein
MLLRESPRERTHRQERPEAVTENTEPHEPEPR